MPKKRGPKHIITDANIRELKELIIEFDEKHNSKSKVLAKDISDYIQMISVQRALSFKPPSLSWWKTTGKDFIKEYNKVKTQTINISETETVDIVDLMDAIEKHGGVNKELLKTLISPTQQIINRLEEKVRNLEKTVGNLNKELEETKTQNKKLNKTNDKLQELVFSLFSVSQQGESGLTNLLNLGKTKSEVVNLSLQKTFGDPLAFVQELTNYRNSKTSFHVQNTNGNVISLNLKNDKLDDIHDDYDY